jgi:NADPH:quinone reductase-like Zn-dependent oxidoreductase
VKAIVFDEFGPPEVLRLAEVAKPVPKDDEVLIRIFAASVNALDWRVMRGTPFPARLMAGGLLRPKPGFRAGVDLAGEVEAVGRAVTEFREGDEVFGPCTGAFGEYTCAKPDRLVRKPSNVSFEEAAGVPIAAMSALQGLRNVGRIRAGHKVLVEGASGGVGTFAVQLAKELGAEVTAVTSTSKVETARSLGADHVLDYTREDFTKSGELYDLILGANAYRPLSDYPRALKPDGVFVMVGGGGSGLLQAALLGLVGRKKTRLLMGKASHTDLVFLADLLGAGKIKTVIDRRYPLAETAEAVRYVNEGHARGKVVITMSSDAGR